MNAHASHSIESLIDSSETSRTAFARPLDPSELGQKSPAALSDSPDPRTSPTYAFLPTQQIVAALHDVGFVPFSAAQAQSRGTSPLFAPHVIRFRRRYETVTLRDCIPEIICLNAHDGRTSLLMLIFICHHWRKWAGNPANLRSTPSGAATVTVPTERSSLRCHDGHVQGPHAPYPGRAAETTSGCTNMSS
jgi:hypothetical protein